jgi:hypothetical protein
MRATQIDPATPYDPRFFASPFGRQGLWRERDFLAPPQLRPARCRVAIVGGGIHGVGLALHLRAAGLPLTDLAIITREPGLLLNFQHHVERIGLGTMRSDYTHTIDGDLQGMIRFAAARQRFLTDYEREQLAVAQAGGLAYPPTDVFFGHAQRLITQAGLLSRTFQAEVSAVCPTADGTFMLRSEPGAQLQAEVVILALGLGLPTLPGPMRSLAAAYPERIKSAFDLAPDEPCQGETILLVGGAQTAVGLMESVCRVDGRLIFDWRDEPRVSPYDVDECYFSREGVTAWQALPLAERAAELRRQSSTITAPYAQLLCRLATEHRVVADGQPTPRLVIKDNPNLTRLEPTLDGRFLATFDDGSQETIDRAYAAVGFTFAFTQIGCLRPLLSQIPTQAGLPIVDDATLQAGPWPLFFGGRANTLAIGPVAVQIAGVAHEAERIIPTIIHHLSTLTTGSPPP